LWVGQIGRPESSEALYTGGVFDFKEMNRHFAHVSPEQLLTKPLSQLIQPSS
jgi:hypothetical protein